MLIDDLKRRSKEGSSSQTGFVEQMGLFDTIKGDGGEAAKTEFYQHDQNWSNRMILGDSLQVMASLAEREGLRGKVQCIYFDPPYGIKFNSNFQWSTTSRDVKDGKPDHITREPEQVKAFRDTWKNGIHSYLGYFTDRVLAAKDLLATSGSVFVQIGEENVHRIRSILEEVFGEDNFVAQICFRTTSNLIGAALGSNSNYILWFAKSMKSLKYRQLYKQRTLSDDIGLRYTRIEMPDFSRRTMTTGERADHAKLPLEARPYTHGDLTSQGETESGGYRYSCQENHYRPSQGRHWTTSPAGMNRICSSGRMTAPSRYSLRFIRYLDDFPAAEISSVWSDTATGAFTDSKVYVVQTNSKVIERCLLMASDPGDLILDPTCGSGTTAAVAEQWGRRWITIDTSRVALALARARIMGARYPYYLLADSSEGKLKEAELSRSIPNADPVAHNIRQGFVYERGPHITLKSLANNTEIDTIWEKWQSSLEPLREQLNSFLGKAWQEWEIPRESQTTEFDKLGPIPVLKARMNADLHMQQDLANSGKGNLFVIFGEPDIDILDATGPDGQPDQIQVKINGVDVFDPSTGEVRSDEPDNIACWFIDSDYNGESFFVRQAYFLGQNDPYKSLKTSLKAEIDLEAWESLNSDISVPFAKPSTGRIAVKVINHLGDEVMKVYRV